MMCSCMGYMTLYSYYLDEQLELFCLTCWRPLVDYGQ